MNKKDREHFLKQCLYDAFRGQFLDLQKDMEKKALDLVPKRFLELVNDKECEKYVGRYSVSRIQIKNTDKENVVIAYQPIYGLAECVPTGRYLTSVEEKLVENVKITSFKVPYNMTTIVIDDCQLYDQYLDLWGRYSQAREALLALCLSYRSQDKFVADFPEYKKYLPPKAVVAKLPTVIIDDVRSSLAELGIPPAVKA